MRFSYTFFLFLLGVILGACATPDTPSIEITESEIAKEERIQYEIVFQSLEEEDQRIREVLHPLLSKNENLCRVKGYHGGIMFLSRYMFSKKDRIYAARALDLDETIRVSQVYAGSIADQMGVKVGDILLQINDRKIDKGRKGYKTFKNSFKGKKKDRARYVFNRKGHTYEVDIKYDLICDYGFQYSYKEGSINAFADGEKVYVSRGMYFFVKNDDELAGILAHELAHNIMVHSKKKHHNGVLGAFIGGVMEPPEKRQFERDNPGWTLDINRFDYWYGKFRNYNSVAFEQEADYVGLYLMDRAGYDISVMPDFWRRVAVEDDISSIEHETTHPTSVARFIALNKGIKEIELKKRRGEPIIPNQRKDRSFRIFETDLTAFEEGGEVTPDQ